MLGNYSLQSWTRRKRKDEEVIGKILCSAGVAGTTFRHSAYTVISNAKGKTQRVDQPLSCFLDSSR
jgi:hypothetical protein